jgi:hypothetical protein
MFLRNFLYQLFLFVFTFQILFAQAADLIIKKSNENPREGDTVKLSLESDKYNLNSAKITWYIDGNETDQGVGRRTFSVNMTNQNPVQVVSVVVQEDGLDDAQTQIILEISGEILLYEGYNSSVPLFYKGRSLPGKEGSANVQLFSFKDGEISDFKPTNYTNNNYLWRVNGEEKKDLSGTNRSQNILTGKVVDSNLNVQILKQNENSGKTLSLNIPIQANEVLVKRLSPDGLLESPIKNTEPGKSISLTIEPFFFSAKNKYSTDLQYTWKINDQENSVSTPWYVSFSGNQTEIVKIDLTIKNTKKIIQTGNAGFTYKVE